MHLRSAPRPRSSFGWRRRVALVSPLLGLTLLTAASCNQEGGSSGAAKCASGSHFEAGKGCVADPGAACPLGTHFEAEKGCVPDIMPAPSAAAPAASAGASPAAELVGTWSGKGCQKDGSCWTIKVVIDSVRDGRPVGTIAYPSLGCEARLEFTRWDAKDAVFMEQYTKQGRCVPNGTLRLRVIDAKKVSYEWAFPDGRVDAVTMLERAP